MKNLMHERYGLEDHLAGLQRAKTALFRDTRSEKASAWARVDRHAARSREELRRSSFEPLQQPFACSPRRIVHVLLAFRNSLKNRKALERHHGGQLRKTASTTWLNSARLDPFTA